MTQSGKPNPNPKVSSHRPSSQKKAVLEKWLSGVPSTALPDLLKTSENVRNVKRRLPTSWYVVMIPDDDVPAVASFKEFEQVADFLKDLIGSPTSVFVFCGIQADITDGPLRYLQHPDGTRLPLFHMLPGKVDGHGYLGDRPLYRSDLSDVNLDPLDPDDADPEEENPPDPEDEDLTWEA